jgi:hypothetical protein
VTSPIIMDVASFVYFQKDDLGLDRDARAVAAG